MGEWDIEYWPPEIETYPDDGMFHKHKAAVDALATFGRIVLCMAKRNSAMRAITREASNATTGDVVYFCDYVID